MSKYQNVVGGRLKLKGKALDVKEGGVKKKRRNRNVRSRLRSDMSFVKVWLITLANAIYSMCLFFLSKRYVRTWMHDLPSLSLIYII
jgi:hypothetical protein